MVEKKGWHERWGCVKGVGIGDNVGIRILVKIAFGIETRIRVLKSNGLPKGVVVRGKYICRKFPEI